VLVRRKLEAASRMAEGGADQPTTVAVGAVKTMPRGLRHIFALDDLETAARRRLPRPIFSFIVGAAETGRSLRANRTAYLDYVFMPRVLVDTSDRSQTKTLFGRCYAAPFGIAPMRGAALAAYQADIVLARAAAQANIPCILSASSLISLEKVARAAPSTWFQAYLPGEAERIGPLVDRVVAAGFDTFVLTVDVPVLGNPENNLRNGFSMPLRPSLRLAWEGISHPRWLVATCGRTILRHGVPHFENLDARRGAPILSRTLVRALGKREGLSWVHVEAIRRCWKGRMILKGILRGEDARRARDSGVDGVIVSNHGGRQLDGAIAPLRALPEVRRASNGMVVMLDGGVRRGTDVLKALMLGADFVFVGRPFLYAAAIGGQEGVARAIDLLREEIDRDMVLLGINGLNQMTPELLQKEGL
jgi:L-lactate dehydrogenase (cytochrome)